MRNTSSGVWFTSASRYEAVFLCYDFCWLREEAILWISRV